MLDPVLPKNMRTLLTDQIDKAEGTMADIAQFWQVVSTVPPEPPSYEWSRLFHREDTFVAVAASDGVYQSRAAQAKANLGKYWQNWSEYYTWFIIGLREVIAA